MINFEKNQLTTGNEIVDGIMVAACKDVDKQLVISVFQGIEKEFLSKHPTNIAVVVSLMLFSECITRLKQVTAEVQASQLNQA